MNVLEEILRYDRVDIRYHGVLAVHDISFTLEKGEILGIVGESGSGKSTLIKAAMGLLGGGGLVTRGDIWYRGLNLPDLSDKERRKINGAEIAMIFQDAGSSFCPVRTMGAQLYESMREHHKISRAEFEARSAETLKAIGFDNPKRILTSFPFELSGGMRQRVGIAAAVLMNPAVLLADEPSSALDVSTQKQVVEELLAIRKRYGVSIVMVTHNLGAVRAMADRILVMKDGEAAEYGDAAQILERPKGDYTRKLIAAAPRLRRT